MRSVAEVAEMFGRAPRTIRSWLARGLMRPIKVGRAVFIPQSEVDALLTKAQPGKARPPRRSRSIKTSK